MYRFKKSLIALTGVLTLVAIVTVALPHIGRGASGTSAPTTQTQNVNVVNTPSVSAQQSGTWNVGINGTPTVTVSNFPATTNVGIDSQANTVKIDTTNPLPVRDVDNPALQPFQQEFDNLFIANGSYGVQQTFPVPAGKRLIMEEVSLQCGVPIGDVPWVAIFADIHSPNGLVGTQINLQFPKLRSLANGDTFASTVPVIAYADGGTDVIVTLGNQSGNGTAGVCSISIVGHFVDMP